MNIASILPFKALEAIRGLVRMADTGSGKQVFSGVAASPIAVTRCAAEGISVQPGAAIAQRSHHRAISPCASQVRPATRPLRVLQVVEKGQTRLNAGRMVISGSMADVCAELDRLVAREAALH